jgi:hypothetical protein
MTDLSIHLRTTCPFCGEHHDRITHATKDDAAPKNGDASMCFACGAFNIVDSTTDEGMRKPTRREQRELDADRRIRDVRRAWQQVKAKQPH